MSKYVIVQFSPEMEISFYTGNDWTSKVENAAVFEDLPTADCKTDEILINFNFYTFVHRYDVCASINHRSRLGENTFIE